MARKYIKGVATAARHMYEDESPLPLPRRNFPITQLVLKRLRDNAGKRYVVFEAPYKHRNTAYSLVRRLRRFPGINATSRSEKYADRVRVWAIAESRTP